jgi:adenosylmethionine-8-amino-7-oxononanoate aminotransferase
LSAATRSRQGWNSCRRFSLSNKRFEPADAEEKIAGGQRQSPADANDAGESAILHAKLDTVPPRIASSNGNYLIAEGGREILDASGGAAVACIGHNNLRVNDAILRQLKSFSYIYAPFFTSEPSEKLARLLSESTQNQLSRAFVVSSGILSYTSTKLHR